MQTEEFRQRFGDYFVVFAGSPGHENMFTAASSLRLVGTVTLGEEIFLVMANRLGQETLFNSRHVVALQPDPNPDH